MAKKKTGNPISTTSEVKTREFYKPRHGVTLVCPACGWKSGGGGYETLAKRDGIEQSIRVDHAQIHSEVLSQGHLRTVTVEEDGQFVQKVPPLVVTKSTHAVEAEHTFVQQTTRQSTTSATYATVSGTSLASGTFDVGETYLIVVTAQIDTGTSSSVDHWIRCVHGSTAFADSEMTTDMAILSASHTYMYWVVWTAVSGEDFHVEHRTGTAATGVGTDIICVNALRLTPDLVLNTDFKHAINNTSTTLVLDTDTTSNNASVNITPTTAAHRWLILSKARYGVGVANATSVQSRIHRAGEATNDGTLVQQEGEDAATSTPILCGMRTDTLGAASNTYTEISQLKATTSATTTSRLNSGIFMMDLDNFKNVAVNQEDSPQEEPNSTTTPHGVLVHSQSLTPTQLGDVWILGHVTMDAGGSNETFTMRLQVDNVDQPANQSTVDYQFNCWTTEDAVCWAIHTVENLSAAAHTADLDGSVLTTGSSRGTLTRNLTLFTFEFAAAAGINVPKNETEAITEGKVVVLGTAGKQIKTETEAITENVIPIVTSALVLIQDENIVFRLSGGTANTSAAASIGGARSTAGGGIISNKLFDDVSLAEASAGDIEYRCFYVLNTHATLTASNVRVWIPTNTPAQDEVDIGLGSSIVNGTEQTVANESTAPTSVTFIQANSEGTSINCGTLPAGQHRAVWLRRIVPSGAAFFPVNTYQLQVSLYSDHS